jgi:hypothetical protein
MRSSAEAFSVLGAMGKILANSVLVLLVLAGCERESTHSSGTADQAAPPESTQQFCRDRGSTVFLHGPLRSISDLEEEGLDYAARNPAAPQVPFAKANSSWQELRDAYRPGDVIRASFTRGFEGRVHTTGYALSRGGCVVHHMTLSIAD